MAILYGVDGCSGGWIAAIKDSLSGVISFRRVNHFSEFFLGEARPSILAIDIPIGLPDVGARLCDKAARVLLGKGRASSVFPAPIRSLLDATTWEKACRKGRDKEGKGVSKQTWAITSKILEIDEMLKKDHNLQLVVREVHPEVSFFFLAKQRPMMFSKKTLSGRAERQCLLEDAFGAVLGIEKVLRQKRSLGCDADDLLDALVALWSAERIFNGFAVSIPVAPEFDACGLRMEIVA